MEPRQVSHGKIYIAVFQFNDGVIATSARFHFTPTAWSSVFFYSNLLKETPDFNVEWKNFRDGLANNTNVSVENYTQKDPVHQFLLWNNGMGSIGVNNLIFNYDEWRDDILWLVDQLLTTIK